MLSLGGSHVASERGHAQKSFHLVKEMFSVREKFPSFLKETSELIKNHIRRCRGIYIKAQEGGSLSEEASLSEDKPVFTIPFFIKERFNLNFLCILETSL